MLTCRGILRALCAAGIFYLAGCGGGGDGGGTVTSTDTFDLKAAFRSDFTDTRTLNFSVSGTVLGYAATGFGTITQSSLSAGTFEGVSAYQKVTFISGSVTANNVAVPISYSSTTYADLNYIPLGQSTTDEYQVVNTGSLNLPTAAKVNDSGTLWTVTRYDSSAKTTVLGTVSATYRLDPDGVHTALLRLTNLDRNAAGTVLTTSTDVYRITPTGGLTWLSETAVDSNSSLTLTFTY